MKENQNKELKLIIGGVILFLLRYIPIYHLNEGIFDKWFSLSNATQLCNTFLGALANQCMFVKPLNIIHILISISLIGYGIYIYVNEHKK